MQGLKQCVAIKGKL